MKIQPSQNRLNAISMESVFAAAEGASDGDLKDVTIDLGDVEFFDPYAVVAFCVLAESLASRMNQRPTILLPDNTNVRNYLRRLRVLEHLRGIADLDCQEDSGPSQPESDVLLELTRIDSKNAIDDATRHLLQIVSANLGYRRRSINAVINLISELCFNVLDHSGGMGWAMAQRYHRSSTGSRFLWIGVADGGMGIKQSLGQRYDTDRWSHLDAILNALKKNFSRCPTRGLGLHMVKKVVFEFGGTLHIRTGDSRLYLAARPQGFRGASFPGTQVGISLSEHEGA